MRESASRCCKIPDERCVVFAWFYRDYSVVHGWLRAVISEQTALNAQSLLLLRMVYTETTWIMGGLGGFAGKSLDLVQPFSIV